ncbi:sialate O-acetylesterase [Flavobacterium seoulense]|uniref:Sialate O-acetylesterase n=1 Tax=Flavobacterium seoulense TaxID=1492738 RepID=A0A066WS97_9FLAO|nr:sialate O-acetylesterase [Flavobacterium seoulense]KDN55453.1 sialate O-acetylesterase [Flavobacterium seoulense]
MKTRFKIIFSLFLLGSFFNVHAIELPKVISDNMVLQRNKPVNIWGKANPNENITVVFKKQIKKTKADAEGKWQLSLAPLKASAVPDIMEINGEQEKITLKNILVGEVWLASGQSNMEYSMNKHPKYAKPKKGDPDYLSKAFNAKQDPRLRVMYVSKNLKSKDLPSDGWHMPDTTNLAPTSAAAYFFAQKLIKELNVPVGIITSAWGGTPIENWTPMQAYTSNPLFADKVKDGYLDKQQVGMRFEAMISPMAPYTLGGFLWYQGETNLINGDSTIYIDKQKALTDSWRAAWNDKKLPFYYVQIAPHNYSNRSKDRVSHTTEALPEFWEAQTEIMKRVPNTAMVVTTDLVDNISDIHPSYKWIVGERLAKLALAKQYGKKELVSSGPVFKKMTIKGDKAILEFDSIGSGLKTTSSDGSLNWFQISGEDGSFQDAKAVIDGNKVIVSSDKISKPANVRFAWNEAAMPNLFNNEGLPALPFRAKK